VKNLLPLLLLVVLFYVLVLRPAQRRQRQAIQVADALTVGAQVVTTSGMLGTVHALDDKHVDLEVSPGVVVRYVKAAVARVVTPDEPDDTYESDPRDDEQEITPADHAVEPAPDPAARSGSSPEDDEPTKSGPA
jgi:preprotein translocase subunit YajC